MRLTRTLLSEALHAVASHGFCGCCWGLPGMVPLILPHAQCLGAAGAHFLWGEELMSGDAEMLQNLVIDPSQS